MSLLRLCILIGSGAAACYAAALLIAALGMAFATVALVCC